MTLSVTRGFRNLRELASATTIKDEAAAINAAADASDHGDFYVEPGAASVQAVSCADPRPFTNLR